MIERTLLPTADGADVRRALTARLRRRPGLTATTLTVLVAATVASLAVPPLLGAVVDAVVDGEGTGAIDQIVVALLVVVVIQSMLYGWARALVARLGEHTLADLREDVVERVLELPLATVEAAGAGDLLARVGEDVDAVSSAMRDAIPALLGAVLTIAFTVVGLAYLDWRLAIAGFAAVPVQFLATRSHLRRSKPLYAAERVAGGRRTHQLNESVNGADTIRAFGLGPHHRRLVTDASAGALDRSLIATWAGSRYFMFLNAAEAIGLAATLLVGFFSVRAGVVTVGQATAAALYFHGLFNPIGMLLTLLDTAQDAGAALARLVGITATPTAPPPTALAADGSVDLDEVTFAYRPGLPVLDALDLRVEPGQHLAIVGPSGAGKSTIGKLVAGIHPPDAGRVSVGGLPVEELTSGTIALVSQEIHVFAGTVADDVRVVRVDATDDDVRAALAAVGAWAWVEALPEGLHTIVGDGGHSLTASEAQHLALARLALSPARVVVLDEATAEAGSRHARTLDDGVAAAIAGRTAIVIAHRLTQAAHADRIAVIDHGALIEAGSHDDLVAAGGVYADLWAAWNTHRGPSERGTHAGR